MRVLGPLLFALALLSLLLPAQPFARNPRVRSNPTNQRLVALCEGRISELAGVKRWHKWVVTVCVVALQALIAQQKPLGSTSAVQALRKCMLLGKSANHRARQISHSHVRTKTTQWVNLHWKQYWWKKGERKVWLRLSTRAIKTVEKFGLEEAAKKFNLNLTDYTLPFSEPRVIL